MKKIKILNSLFFLLWVGSSLAQQFHYSAKVENVKEEGYFKILLSPSLLGKLNNINSDIRLFDEEAKEQAYFIQQSKRLSEKSMFKEYEIIDKSIGNDSVSIFIFKNSDRKKINNISIIVTNTDVKKRARLSGSNDNKKWFVIKNDYLLHSMKNAKDTSELKILNFPLSNYQFFKLEIEDKHELPINILRLGYYDTQKVKGATTAMACKIISLKDSNKVSYYKIELPSLSYLEQLKINIKGSEFYDREAIIKIKKTQVNQKKKVVPYFETIRSVNLNSNSDNEINLGSRKMKSFYLEIKNKDDQPLKIEKITASFLNKYLVAELSPQKMYIIKFGDPSLQPPDYDIKNFRNKINLVNKTISHEKIKKISSNKKPIKASSWFESPYFLWSAILIIGLLLGFISIKMVREMK